MPPKRTDIDTDHLVQLYESGQSPAHIGKQFGITGQTVRDRLQKAGVALRSHSAAAAPRRAANFDITAAARQYTDDVNTTITALAAEHGTTVHLMRIALVGAGVQLRTTSEVARRTQISLDTESIVSRYLAGESPTNIGRTLGVSITTIVNRLTASGTPLRDREQAAKNRRAVLDTKSTVRRYLAGESEHSIASESGVSRAIVRRTLVESGITPRNRSDAMFTRMGNATPAERAELVTAAHAAVRGVRRTESELEKRARTWQRREERTSPLEPQFGEMLAMRGVETIPQLAVGRYNVDLAAWPVAVEVHNSVGHPIRQPRLVERTMYLAERGWHTLFVWTTPRAAIKFTPGCADQVVALMEIAETDPTSFGEYRVIRGAGEDASGLHRERYERPDIRGAN